MYKFLRTWNNSTINFNRLKG